MHINRRVDFLESSALSSIRDPGLRRAMTHDGLMTYDQLTIDSTGAFLVGELERLDPTMHEPLAAVTWPRDIDLREDVTAADEISSYTVSSYAAAGGILPNDINWSSKNATANAGIELDIGKITHPLKLWDMELGFTIPELISAQKLGRPIDEQKLKGIKLKHQMDIDQQVYTGNTTFGDQGMFNNSNVTATNVVNGSSGSPLWANKSPDEILADVNTLLTNVWTTSGYAIMPRELRIPPAQYGYLTSQKVSLAGNISIIEFLRNNSLCKAANGVELNIQPVKWLPGLGAGSTNRMVAYTRDKDRIRYPLVPLQRTPVQYRGIYQIVVYWCRLGVVEIVYPETMGYADGI